MEILLKFQIKVQFYKAMLYSIYYILYIKFKLK